MCPNRRCRPARSAASSCENMPSLRHCAWKHFVQCRNPGSKKKQHSSMSLEAAPGLSFAELLIRRIIGVSSPLTCAPWATTSTVPTVRPRPRVALLRMARPLFTNIRTSRHYSMLKLTVLREVAHHFLVPAPNPPPSGRKRDRIRRVYSPPSEGGVAAPSIKCCEATLKGADGVVTHAPCFKTHFAT